MKCLIIGVQKQNTRKKNLISDFKLPGVNEFCEVSHESLLLTGTPSVRNLKF